jgi:hypothetical protein
LGFVLEPTRDAAPFAVGDLYFVLNGMTFKQHQASGFR